MNSNGQVNLLLLLEEKLQQTQALLKQCETLMDNNIEGAVKLRRKVLAEIDFLNRVKDHPRDLRADHVNSTNLTHLGALCDVALREKGVVAVLAPFDRFDEPSSSLLIDVVADGGSTWIKVVARSPKGLHMAWAGEGGYQERSIIEQGKDYVSTALKNPYLYQPPKVVFVFCAGVTQPIIDDLKRSHIETRGNVVPVDSRWCGSEALESDSSSSSAEDDSERHAGPRQAAVAEDTCGAIPPTLSRPIQSIVSEDETPLNLDITALIAYVSNLTNDNGAEYRFREPLLDEQASWERQRPALPHLKKAVDCGRRLICCATAYHSYQSILHTVGGENEKRRSESLMQRVNVVDDRLSDRAAKLRLGGKIKERSRTIFGSGDYYRAITLTANRGFVFAAGNQGVRFAVTFHESRALSEQKQQHATPLPSSALKDPVGEDFVCSVY